MTVLSRSSWQLCRVYTVKQYLPNVFGLCVELTHMHVWWVHGHSLLFVQLYFIEIR